MKFTIRSEILGSLKHQCLQTRHHAASTTVDNKIYVTGGRIAGSSPLVNVNVNEMYDTKKDKWTQIESMPSKRSGIAAATINNKLLRIWRRRSY